MNIADPIVEIEGMLTLHMEMVCMFPFINMVTCKIA